jgi:hypothetical protein
MQSAETTKQNSKPTLEISSVSCLTQQNPAGKSAPSPLRNMHKGRPRAGSLTRSRGSEQARPRPWAYLPPSALPASRSPSGVSTPVCHHKTAVKHAKLSGWGAIAGTSSTKDEVIKRLSTASKVLRDMSSLWQDLVGLCNQQPQSKEQVDQCSLCAYHTKDGIESDDLCQRI